MIFRSRLREEHHFEYSKVAEETERLARALPSFVQDFCGAGWRAMFGGRVLGIAQRVGTTSAPSHDAKVGTRKVLQ